MLDRTFVVTAGVLPRESGIQKAGQEATAGYSGPTEDLDNALSTSLSMLAMSAVVCDERTRDLESR